MRYWVARRFTLAWVAGGVLVALGGCSPELAAGPTTAAAPAASQEKAPITQVFVLNLLRIGREYGWTSNKITATASWAPWLCRAPDALHPFVDAGTTSGPHGRKLYYLFVSNEAAYRKGGAQPMGQTIVKESWHPRLQPPGAKPEAIPRTAQLDGKTYVPGDKGPLFVMTKLAPETPDTDAGWVYATLSPRGDTVTSAGRIASCMGCHEKGTQDRLFRKLPKINPAGK